MSTFFLLFLGSFNPHDGIECKDDKEDEKREFKWKPGKQDIAVTISNHEVVSQLKSTRESIVDYVIETGFEDKLQGPCGSFALKY